MKIYKKLIFIPFGIIFILLCLLMRLFFIKVSFFEINNKYFGHFALDIAIKRYQAKKNNSLIIFACFTNKKSVNRALEEISKIEIKIVPKIILIPAMTVLNKLNNNFTSWLGYINFGKYREFGKYPLLEQQDCRIDLSDIQASKSKEILHKYGILNKNFICLAIRDEEFHAGNLNNNLQNYRNINFSLLKNTINDNKDLIFFENG